MAKTKNSAPVPTRLSPAAAKAPNRGRGRTFAVDEVNVLTGVGKGVVGIKLDEGDSVIGGTLTSTSRFDKLTVETENGKTQEFGTGAYPIVTRGGKGTKPGARTNFVRVVPAPITLVNWDEIG